MKRHIDANALKDRIRSSPLFPNFGEDGHFIREFILELVDEQDTADVVEVRHGKWRVETDEEMPNPMFKLLVCSSCGATANNLYCYCPNCGAKMDGERSDIE